MENNVKETKKSGKVFTFILGVLVGAIITTSIFLVYTKVNNKNTANTVNSTATNMVGGPGENGGTPPNMPSGSNMSGQRPSGNNIGKPPAKPGESTNTTSANTESATTNTANQ